MLSKVKKEIKQPLLIEATENTEENLKGTFSFKNHEGNFDKVIDCCFMQKCKYLDTSDLPNFFCDKAYQNGNAVGMVDFHSCLPECPLKKWKLIDLNKTCEVSVDETSRCLTHKEKEAIIDFYTNPPFRVAGEPTKVKQETIEQILEEINADCQKKGGKN